MSKSDVIEVISSIPIGTIIAWVSVFILILGVIYYGLLRLYKLFETSRKVKEENDDFKEMVKSHDKQLTTISEQLGKIQATLDKQDELSVKNMRHSIIHSGEEALSNGFITIRKLRALEELYDEYKDYNGNGYVTTLLKKVRVLPVVGALDENGEDVEQNE